jgi:hypothetical protein
MRKQCGPTGILNKESKLYIKLVYRNINVGLAQYSQEKKKKRERETLWWCVELCHGWDCSCKVWMRVSDAPWAGKIGRRKNRHVMRQRESSCRRTEIIPRQEQWGVVLEVAGGAHLTILQRQQLQPDWNRGVARRQPTQAPLPDQRCSAATSFLTERTIRSSSI